MDKWNHLSLPEYWSERYQTGQDGWDNGQAHPFLPRVAAYLGDELKKSSLLVIGAGPGHDAEYFSGITNQVTAVDFSEKAHEKFKKTYPKSTVNYQIADFLNPDAPLGKFDVIFEHTLLCAIDPLRYKDYFSSLRRHLNPGGIYAAIIWDKSPVDDGPPFSVPIKTVLSNLKENFKIHIEYPVGMETFPHRHHSEIFLMAKIILKPL